MSGNRPVWRLPDGQLSLTPENVTTLCI